MRVYGYSRVSTDKQSEEGVSLEAQAVKIQAYCTTKDFTLTEIIEDAGYSAKSLDRPGMERLLALVESKQVDVIVVTKLDRLTRSVSDVNKLLEIFNRKGVKLVSLAESLDATTATGELMINLLASVSQWERKVIGERTKDAMRHLKSSGKVYSRPVFIDQRAIDIMKDCRNQGLSYAAIATRMNELSIPTARGDSWQAYTVQVILDRALVDCSISFRTN